MVALAPAPGADARSRRLSLEPARDAFVRADAPRARLGGLTSLRVDGRPRARALLRFRVPRLRGRAVARASLRLYVLRGERRGIRAGATGPGKWSERRLTWRGAPALRAPVASSIPARGRWVSIDVTPLVHGGGAVDVALTSARARGSVLASREVRRRAPRLIVSHRADRQPGAPTRTAFYSTAFPEAWTARGARHHPALGPYATASRDVIAAHVRAMRWGGIAAALAPWDGRGTSSDVRLKGLLATTRSRFRWAAEARGETRGDPRTDRIVRTLVSLDGLLGRHPTYLRVRGRPVAFVRLGPDDRCADARRWARANASVGVHLVLQAFAGHRSCRAGVDGWYGRGAARASERARDSFTISPGSFRAADGSPRLTRDLTRWHADIRAMIASRSRWQLVSSFNGWDEGTAVESAAEWASRSGQGAYLDALRARGLVAAARPGGDPVIAAAGDIACDPSSANFNGGLGTSAFCRQRDTSELLLRERLDAVLPLGDVQYEQATLAQFMASFDRSWGRLGPLLRPVIGNHEYQDPAGGYWRYFGARAGTAGLGWYSFDLGAWHLIALNSNCSLIGGCGPSSPQMQWLRADLAAHPSACTLAYFHHPLYASTGPRNGAPTGAVRPLWRELYRSGVELVLNGHAHHYERFARLTPDGALDPSGGLREFVVGTGGKNLLPIDAVAPASELRQNTSFGVLRLALNRTGYEWRFVPAQGGALVDAGAESCR